MRKCIECGTAIPWQYVKDGKKCNVATTRRYCLECKPIISSKTKKDGRGHKQCLNCNKVFKTRQIIDGEERDLNIRKYCLECSPFGNRRGLIFTVIKTRCCIACNKELDGAHFTFKKKDGDGHRIAISKMCRECFKKQEAQKHRDFKKKCVDYKGGACQECGYNKCMKALTFHHIDPSQKDFEISKYQNLQMSEKLIAELNKCILLCFNCHMEIHDTMDRILD